MTDEYIKDPGDVIDEVPVAAGEAPEEGVRRLFYKVWERRVEDVWQKFQEGGFSPMLIKGWAVSIFYPDPFERDFVDIDLVFSETEFDEAKIFYGAANVGALVDFHKNVRHLDELSYHDLYDKSVLKRCGDTNVRVPCDEDHLRILCVHWLNDGGEDRKRLWDIYHAISNRRADFDWERCLNVVGNRRRRWVICTILLANRYLNLSLDGIPLSDADRKLPDWIVKTVEFEWEHGTPLQPLHSVLDDDTTFWVQFRKRLFLNPIQATIETGGDFDARTRVWYKIRAISKRIYPSFQRISDSYRWKIKLWRGKRNTF